MKKLTQKEVQAIIEGTGTVLFTTPSCGRCDTVKEMCRNLEVSEFQVVLDVYPQKRLKINEAPIVINFKDGKETGRLKGVNNTQAYINLQKA